MTLIDPKTEAYRIMAADKDVVRIIERMGENCGMERPTRQERRQWNKPAKKPKALRGRP